MAARFKLFELFGALGLDASQFKSELRTLRAEATVASQQLGKGLSSGFAAGSGDASASVDSLRLRLRLLEREAASAGSAVRQQVSLLGRSAGFGGPGLGSAAALLGGGALGIAGGVGAAVLGIKEFISAVNDMDVALKHIRGSTGETGAALGDLHTVFIQTLRDVPASAKDAADAIASLHQRTGATGEVLRDLTAQELTLARITGTDVRQQVLLTTKAFQDWGIATERQGAFMDYLLKIWQKTGTPINTILSQLDRFGEPLKTAGFSAEQAAAMIAKMDKEGVSVTATLSGLRWGAVAVARANQDLVGGFQETIDAIKGAKTEQEALTIAASVFKTKAATDIMRAAREGRMEIADFMKQLQASTDTIQKAGVASEGLSQSWQRFKNSASIAADAFTPILSAGANLLTLFTQLQNIQTQGFMLGARGIAGMLTGQPPIIMLPEARSRVGLTMPPEAWARSGRPGFTPDLSQQIAQLQADAGLGTHTEAQIRDQIVALQDLIKLLRQAGGHFYDLRTAEEALTKAQEQLAGNTKDAAKAFDLLLKSKPSLDSIISSSLFFGIEKTTEDLKELRQELALLTPRISMEDAAFAGFLKTIRDVDDAAEKRKAHEEAANKEIVASDAALRSLASAAGDTRFELDSLQRSLDIVTIAVRDGALKQEDLTRATHNYDMAVQRIIERGTVQARVLRQVSTILTDLGRGFADILLPRGGGGRDAEEEKRRNVLSILKQAADEFAQKGYSEPIKALGNFIGKIKAASTDAEANALAMRVLGRANQELVATIRHGGPAFEQMLQELRQGYPLLDRLAASTEQSTGRLSRMKQMLEEVGRSIIRMGIEGVINSTALSNAFRKLGDVLLRNLDILGQLIRHIPLVGRAIDDFIFGPRGGGAIGTLSTVYANQVSVIGQNVTTVGGGGDGRGGPGPPGMGGTSAAPSGAAGWIGAISGAVGAVASIIQAYQLHGIGSDTGRMEVSLRGILAEAQNIRVDSWMREEHLMLKLDDMWKTLQFGFDTLSLVMREIRDTGRIALGLPAGGAGAAPAISQTNNFYGLSGQQAAQTVLDDIVRLLEARGLRAPA